MWKTRYLDNREDCLKSKRPIKRPIKGKTSIIFLVSALLILFISSSGLSLLTTGVDSTNKTSAIVNSTSVSSSNAISNSDLTTILSLSSMYYTKNDMVDIYIHNTTAISNIGDLFMEISVLEYPTYSFRYLGLLDNKVSFIPEKSGTYTVKLYSMLNGNYVDIAEKSFYVYDADIYNCKNYGMNSLINIDLKSYDYYATRSLPNSLTLVYTDNSNNSEVFVYADKIEGVVEYKVARPGRYALFSEGQYLDCFIASDVNDVNVNTNLNTSNSATTFNNLTNASNIISDFGNMSDILTNNTITNSSNDGLYNTSNTSISATGQEGGLEGGLDASFLSGDRRMVYNNFYSESESKTFDFSKDKLRDIRGMDNGILIAEISRSNIYGFILELWAIDVNTGVAKRIAFNESAPSYKIRPGIKEGVIFWVSEFNDKVYAYDTVNGITVSRNLPSYDLGKGEIGRVSFNNTVIHSNWDVLVDGSQIYFYSPSDGEVFSDDNSDIKEEYRQRMNLDKYFSSDELSSLSLEVKQEDVVVQ